MTYIRVLTLITALTLIGCAGLNSEFNCPKQPGVMCNSLDEVNAKIDQGNIGANTVRPKNTVPMTPPEKSLPSAITPFAAVTAGESTAITPTSWRSADTVIPIWIAPFEDDLGNYHSASQLYAVVAKGRWHGELVTAVSSLNP